MENTNPKEEGQGKQASIEDGIREGWLKLHPQTPQLQVLMTLLRSQSITRVDWIFYADRIARLMIEYALNYLPIDLAKVETPLNEIYQGARFRRGIVGVSILRAGQTMEVALRSCCRGVRIGKILIQRDEVTSLPKMFLSKLVRDLDKRFVLCMDPMLATGGSAMSAVDELIKAGAEEEKILFVSVLAAPEGVLRLHKARPKITIATAQLGRGLNENNYIVPAIGDWGDRYFGSS